MKPYHGNERMTRKGVIIVPSAMPLQEASDADMVWSSDGKDNVNTLEAIFHHCSDIVFVISKIRRSGAAGRLRRDDAVKYESASPSYPLPEA